MDAGVLILALGGASGFAAAFAAAQTAQQMRRRAFASRIVRDEKGASADNALSRVLRNGIPLFKRSVGVVRRFAPASNFIGGLVQWAQAVGAQTSDEALGSVLLAALVVLALVASLIALTPVAGIATCALLVVFLALRLQAWRQAQRDATGEAVPEVLSTMGECFQSGYSLVQTMDMVARQTKGELGVAFERCADTLRMGGTAKEALAHLQKIEGADELSFIAVALDVQHQSGGSIVAILAVTQEIVQDKVELRRSLRVQTAQARLSARVVCLMPFVLVAILSLVSDGFLSPFFSSFAGIALLVIAILMEGAGVVLVRKMLRGVER